MLLQCVLHLPNYRPVTQSAPGVACSQRQELRAVSARSCVQSAPAQLLPSCAVSTCPITAQLRSQRQELRAISTCPTTAQLCSERQELRADNTCPFTAQLCSQRQKFVQSAPAQLPHSCAVRARSCVQSAPAQLLPSCAASARSWIRECWGEQSDTFTYLHIIQSWVQLICVILYDLYANVLMETDPLACPTSNSIL